MLCCLATSLYRYCLQLTNYCPITNFHRDNEMVIKIRSLPFQGQVVMAGSDVVSPSNDDKSVPSLGSFRLYFLPERYASGHG